MIKIIDDRCGGDSCEEQKKLYEELKIKRQEKSSYKIHPQMTLILQIYLW